MARNTMTSAQPAYTDTIELRIVRHVWPSGWIRTSVSRPLTCVVCGEPERASLHTGWLLSGWTIWRSCCCFAEFASAALVAGEFWAAAPTLTNSSDQSTTSRATSVTLEKEIGRAHV